MPEFGGFDPDGVADELAWAFALFVSLLALWEIVSAVTSSPEHQPRRTEQAVTLHESALRRLEDGETVRVERWHGHTVELSGTQVIDVTTVEEEE